MVIDPTKTFNNRETTFNEYHIDALAILYVALTEYTQWNVFPKNREPVYLDFNIEAGLFATDEKMKEELGKVSDVILKNSNGSGIKNTITATLLPVSNGNYFLFYYL